MSMVIFRAQPSAGACIALSPPTCSQRCRMPLMTSSEKSDSMERSAVGSFLPFLAPLPLAPFFLAPFFLPPFFLPFFLPAFAAFSASSMSLRFCSRMRISASTCTGASVNMWSYCCCDTRMHACMHAPCTAPMATSADTSAASQQPNALALHHHPACPPACARPQTPAASAPPSPAPRRGTE